MSKPAPEIITVQLSACPGHEELPTSMRIRTLLKFALRACRLRCVSVVSTSGAMEAEGWLAEQVKP